ncbi:hypothetical protein GCM10023210_31000 [Chryseobacterium ginsengisoli]|uniref:Uncharacterized protein n=1 Tax=Chryseobacterium ginsengisoli TaxID=363853 RepID=A0ABP9MLD2_9FLAO
MKKYTEEKRNIYQETLALDTIYNVLSWHDRTILHRVMTGEIGANELNGKVSMLYEFVSITKWKTPLMKFGQDRLLYFYDEQKEKDRPIEEYKTVFPNITNDLKNIQNEYS